MYERDAGPAWLVFDQNHRNRHLFTLDVPGFWYAPGAVIPACRQRLLTGHGPQLRGGRLRTKPISAYAGSALPTADGAALPARTGRPADERSLVRTFAGLQRGDGSLAEGVGGTPVTCAIAG
ncbi:hypothetical protein AB0C18_34260 [Nonomuraea muscovyensis]|uniref:hypothetical protein n=1 Tax=Nonomuraea muscovyensis TaxID=1124761 RepID=UPI0033E54021